MPAKVPRLAHPCTLEGIRARPDDKTICGAKERVISYHFVTTLLQPPQGLCGSLRATRQASLKTFPLLTMARLAVPAGRSRAALHISYRAAPAPVLTGAQEEESQ